MQLLTSAPRWTFLPLHSVCYDLQSWHCLQEANDQDLLPPLLARLGAQAFLGTALARDLTNRSRRPRTREVVQVYW